VNFVGWKIPFQLAHELPDSASTFSYRGGQRAIEFTMKKVLPVFRIEAHDIGWQHVHREIRRELWNVFAVMLRKAVLVIACHEVSTLFATASARQRKANSPPAKRSRASVPGFSASR
jgi:hypothetical protein